MSAVTVTQGAAMAAAQSARAQRLRDAGYRLTQPRLAVLEALERSRGHVTSAELLQMTPDVGRASVFRALDLFTRLAIVRPAWLQDSSTPRYLLLPDGHHHHILCTACDRVIDFDDCHLEPLQRELEDRYGMRLRGHLLEFYGHCPDCAEGPAG